MFQQELNWTRSLYNVETACGDRTRLVSSTIATMRLRLRRRKTVVKTKVVTFLNAPKTPNFVSNALL